MTTTTDTADEFEQAPPEKLQAHCRRQLSAMLDGELPPDEAKFMLRRVGHDAELSGCWERWQLAGDVMRGHALVLPADFSQRVAAAIAFDGRATATAAAARGGWLQRWGGRLALAASVAAVTFVVARQWPAIDAGGTEPAPAMAVDAFAIDPAALALMSGAPADAGVPAGGEGADVPAQATAAVAVAAAAAGQRRRAAEATRRQAAAVATPEAVAAAPVLVAVRAADADVDAAPAARPLADAGALFAPPSEPRAAARPWPRAVLQGTAAGGPLAAGYGGIGFGADGQGGGDADPFAPRAWPTEPAAATADAQPSP